MNTSTQPTIFQVRKETRQLAPVIDIMEGLKRIIEKRRAAAAKPEPAARIRRAALAEYRRRAFRGSVLAVFGLGVC